MTGGTVNLDNNGRLWSGKAYGDVYNDMVFSGGTINMIGTNGDSYITGTVTSNKGGNKLRARTKMERFFSQNGTNVADRGTPKPLIVLSKWNDGRTKLERPSLKTELASFSL